MVGTPSPQTISTKQLELAQRAKRYPHEALSTLAHFIDTDRVACQLERYRASMTGNAPATVALTHRSAAIGICTSSTHSTRFSPVSTTRRAQLLNALKGHVLAEAQLVGTYQKGG